MSNRAERRRAQRQRAHQRGEDRTIEPEIDAPLPEAERDEPTPSRRHRRRQERRERNKQMRAFLLRPLTAIGADIDSIQDPDLRAGAWLMVKGMVMLVIGSTMATVAPVDEEWLGVAALVCMGISVVFVGLAIRAAWPWIRRANP